MKENNRVNQTLSSMPLNIHYSIIGNERKNYFPLEMIPSGQTHGVRKDCESWSVSKMVGSPFDMTQHDSQSFLTR